MTRKNLNLCDVCSQEITRDYVKAYVESSNKLFPNRRYDICTDCQVAFWAALNANPYLSVHEDA